MSDIRMVERLTECTLTTVEYMVFLKSKSKSEYQRQQVITQEGISYLMERSLIPYSKYTRCYRVLNEYKGSVKLYIENMEKSI